MEIKDKLQETINSLAERISSQTWFQEIKTKWDEQDKKTKSIIKYATSGAGFLFIFILFLNFVLGINSLKNELARKSDIFNLIQSASKEFSKPTKALDLIESKKAKPWVEYFSDMAIQNVIEGSSITSEAINKPNDTDIYKEFFYKINLKHVSIRQVIKYVFNLENDARPIKLRKININTNADPDGYMDAELLVSAFETK